MEEKVISLRVSPEYDRKIRVTAARLDMTRSDFIRAAIDAKLAELTQPAEVQSAQGKERAE
jgi:predicted DNA-binding protein